MICSSLSSINIPSTITKVGYKDFEHCDSLSNTYYPGVNPPTYTGSPFKYSSNFNYVNVELNYNGTEFWGIPTIGQK